MVIQSTRLKKLAVVWSVFVKTLKESAYQTELILDKTYFIDACWVYGLICYYMEPLRLSIDYKGKHLEAEALPVNTHKIQGVPLGYTIFLLTERLWFNPVHQKKLVSG